MKDELERRIVEFEQLFPIENSMMNTHDDQEVVGAYNTTTGALPSSPQRQSSVNTNCSLPTTPATSEPTMRTTVHDTHPIPARAAQTATLITASYDSNASVSSLAISHTLINTRTPLSRVITRHNLFSTESDRMEIVSVMKVDGWKM